MRGIALLWLLCAAPGHAAAYTPTLRDYQHDMWTANDGMPADIWSLAEDNQGWLWIASMAGLYRFDGIHVQPFQPAPGEALLSEKIGALSALPNGDLWICYAQGHALSLLRNGHLLHYTEQNGYHGGACALGITGDLDNNLWVAGSDGLMRFSAGRWTRLGPAQGFGSGLPEGLNLDRQGRLWVTTAQRVYLYQRAQQRFIDAGPHSNQHTVMQAPDGQIWLWGPGGTSALPGPLGHAEGPVPARPPINNSDGALFDHQGNLWQALCPPGVCRFTPAVWRGRTRIDAATRQAAVTAGQQAPASAEPLVMLEDRQSNLWVTTRLGLDRYRPNAFVRVPLPDFSSYIGIAAQPDGKVWASTLSSPEGHLWRVDQGVQAVPGVDPLVHALAVAHDGALLAGGRTVLQRYDASGVRAAPMPPEIQTANSASRARALLDDGSGIWARFSYGGLWRRPGDSALLGMPSAQGTWLRASSLGLPDGAGPVALALDAQQRVWLGYSHNRLLRYDHGQITQWGAADGIDVLNINFVSAGRELVIAGEKGLQVLQGNRFKTLYADEPGVLNGITALLRTPDGSVWLNGRRGVLRISATQWQAALDNPATPLHYRLLGAHEGYRGEATAPFPLPSAALSPDGLLWFASSDGLLQLDPAQLAPVAPTHADFLQVAVNDQRWSTDQPVTLPAGTRELQIAYTALGSRVPEQVRFRYQLEGVDPDWKSVGTRRDANYTNLGPGEYRFRLQAITPGSAWPEDAAELHIRITPRFDQTGWFALLGLLLLGGALVALYRWRVRYLTRQIYAQMNTRLQERQDIARTLHDTFLQAVYALTLRFQTVQLSLPPGHPLHPQMDDAMERAEALLEEGRDQVMNLRSEGRMQQGLFEALRQVGTDLMLQHGVPFEARRCGSIRALSPGVIDNLFQLGREAMINAYQHAQARHIQLRLDYKRREFVLSVCDDGRGLDAEILQRGHKDRHWGIPGMTERANKIGGTLQIDSMPTRGTRIVVTLPARAAYLPRAWPWRRWPGR
ncbi:sensor histidine kinase [Amantichitinum ursilacus]|uniref:Sensor histidine kinase LiaS n=1 Tax=Amantichitinum ursilacus TaxID=857265 RepID=A0A0N1JTA5_9NEIS|nr:sensor histidine kinase [Amantichitinum ursilacus]KPC54397.1 Sensor histidine kinase LiaS [Amantichitinum ursilacus]